MSEDTVYTIIGFASGVLFIILLNCVVGLLM